ARAAPAAAIPLRGGRGAARPAARAAPRRRYAGPAPVPSDVRRHPARPRPSLRGPPGRAPGKGLQLPQSAVAVHLPRRWLGRRDLEALVLDQLLETVDDLEVAVGVGGRDVAGVEPALGVHGRSRRVGIVQVAAHHLRATDPKLAPFALGDVAAIDGIDEPA